MNQFHGIRQDRRVVTERFLSYGSEGGSDYEGDADDDSFASAAAINESRACFHKFGLTRNLSACSLSTGQMDSLSPPLSPSASPLKRVSSKTFLSYEVVVEQEENKSTGMKKSRSFCSLTLTTEENQEQTRSNEDWADFDFGDTCIETMDKTSLDNFTTDTFTRVSPATLNLSESAHALAGNVTTTTSQMAIDNNTIPNPPMATTPQKHNKILTHLEIDIATGEAVQKNSPIANFTAETFSSPTGAADILETEGQGSSAQMSTDDLSQLSGSSTHHLLSPPKLLKTATQNTEFKRDINTYPYEVMDDQLTGNTSDSLPPPTKFVRTPPIPPSPSYSPEPSACSVFRTTNGKPNSVHSVGTISAEPSTVGAAEPELDRIQDIKSRLLCIEGYYKQNSRMSVLNDPQHPMTIAMSDKSLFTPQRSTKGVTRMGVRKPRWPRRKSKTQSTSSFDAPKAIFAAFLISIAYLLHRDSEANNVQVQIAMMNVMEKSLAAGDESEGRKQAKALAQLQHQKARMIRKPFFFFPDTNILNVYNMHDPQSMNMVAEATSQKYYENDKDEETIYLDAPSLMVQQERQLKEAIEKTKKQPWARIEEGKRKLPSPAPAPKLAIPIQDFFVIQDDDNCCSLSTTSNITEYFQMRGYEEQLKFQASLSKFASRVGKFVAEKRDQSQLKIQNSLARIRQTPLLSPKKRFAVPMDDFFALQDDEFLTSYSEVLSVTMPILITDEMKKRSLEELRRLKDALIVILNELKKRGAEELKNIKGAIVILVKGAKGSFDFESVGENASNSIIPWNDFYLLQDNEFLVGNLTALATKGFHTSA